MRNRRLVAAFAVAAVVAVLGGGAVLRRSWTLDEHARACRQKGMEAAQAGDYVVALDQVGRYLQRFGKESDTEALYAYAKARRHVPLPNAKHLYDAIGILRRTLDADPGHEQARMELLDLYLSVGYGKETLALAGDILNKNPDDVPALRAEAIALGRLREFEAALKRTARIARLSPEDIDNHNLALEFMNRLTRPEEELLSYADNQPGLSPNGAAYQLVKSIACELTGDRQQAIEWAERATSTVPDNLKQVVFADRLLNALGRPQTALELLEAASNKIGDADLERLLARRLFEGGNTQGFMERSEKVPLAKQDATSLGLRAIGYASQNDSQAVKRIVAELEGRKNDNAAKAWAPVLRAKFIEEGSPQVILAACKDGIKRDPSNPYFHYFQGWAYEQLRESGLALQSWNLAHQLAPGWIDPQLRSAAVLAYTGRSEEASRLALDALERAPQSFEVATTMSAVLGNNIDGLSSAGQQQLFSLVDGIQNDHPFEPRTLPMYVELMARISGRDAAKGRIQAVLEGDAKLSEDALLQIAHVSDKYDLGFGDACRGRVEETIGSTASLTLARAIALHEKGNSEGGRKMLLERAGAAGDSVEWLKVVAQYLELTGGEDALAAWSRVSDAAPENAAVQQRVLVSEMAWRDLGLVSRAIDRLKNVTGEEGAAWRAAKARWLLESDGSPKAAAEASALMTDAVRNSLPTTPQYSVLAAALERLGDTKGALDSLSMAAQLDPMSPGPKFELVRLHQARGNYLNAEPYLEQLAKMNNLSSVEVHHFAELLARQGQINRAIEVLLNSLPQDERDAPANLLLARLYRSSGQMDKAEAVAQRLLDGTPDGPTIAFIADLFAVRGQAEKGREVLARLDKMELSPGLRESLHAEFERSHGRSEEAKRLYDAALAAAPHDPLMWRRCIDFTVRNKELGRAIGMIAKAHEACPENDLFSELEANLGLINAVGLRPVAQPFLLSAMNSPERLTEVLESLEAIGSVPDDNPSRLATELLQLSNRYPSFLPVKLQLIRVYSSLGRRDEAARMASQTMRDFPGAVEAARAAAEALPAAGQWEEALKAAQDWRRRAGVPSAEADVVIAGAQIELQRPEEALETLRPYVDGLEKDYAGYSPVCHLYARALIKLGRVAEAEGVLTPRLQVSDKWRKVWISLAATTIDDCQIGAQWLERVAAVASRESLDEQLALASGWANLADRSKNETYLVRARQILETLSSHPGISERATLALGMVADREGDYAKAEISYRLALQMDPGSALAKNNLAMLLVNTHKSLDEALRLAQEAVQSEPGNAGYLDTLGFVCAARGDYDEAVKVVRRAVELEPGEQQWRDRLAELEKRQAEHDNPVPAAS